MSDAKTLGNKATNNQDLLMVSLARFYANKAHVATIAPIIQGQQDISLRIIDWFVTNYAKMHGTVITQRKGNNVVHFNVYLSYRSQLKAYSKHAFDPFRRRERITFFYDATNSIETTIGQLNFFRWMIENNILQYIHDHLTDIEDDMIRAQKKATMPLAKGKQSSIVDKSFGPTSPTKKRNEISRSFVRNMSRFEGSRVISFD